MIRTLWTYAVTFFYMILLKSRLQDEPFKNAQYATKISRKAVGAAGYRIQVIGMENIPNEDGVLYVSNHQSFFDIFASFVIVNKQLAFVAKQQLKNFFYVGLYVEKLGGVLIDREDIRSQVDMLVRLTKNIQAGYNAFIFPEGTRTKDGSLAEFKGGSFKIALKSKCKIVPITYFNNHEVVKNQGDKLIKVRIDPPLLYDDYKSLTTTEIGAKIQGMIQKNLDNGFDPSLAETIFG